MKRAFSVVAVVLIMAGIIYSFTPRQTAYINGRVIPAEGADMVWAVNERDSIGARPADGQFSIKVKAGWYQVYVIAKSPYKNVQLNKLEVKEGSTIDLGEIRLEK